MGGQVLLQPFAVSGSDLFFLGRWGDLWKTNSKSVHRTCITQGFSRYRWTHGVFPRALAVSDQIDLAIITYSTPFFGGVQPIIWCLEGIKTEGGKIKSTFARLPGQLALCGALPWNDGFLLTFYDKSSVFLRWKAAASLISQNLISIGTYGPPTGSLEQDFRAQLQSPQLFKFAQTFCIADSIANKLIVMEAGVQSREAHTAKGPIFGPCDDAMVSLRLESGEAVLYRIVAEKGVQRLQGWVEVPWVAPIGVAVLDDSVFILDENFHIFRTTLYGHGWTVLTDRGDVSLRTEEVTEIK
jgi:hypothetical protein